MRLLLLLMAMSIVQHCNSQTCGCPAGYYGGYYAGASPATIYYRHDNVIDTLTSVLDGQSLTGCTGYVRWCKNGGSPCLDFSATHSSATYLPSLGHPTCELATGISDVSCTWEKTNKAYDPDPGVYKRCYCYSCNPCPAGTYNPSPSATSPTSCLNCPANYWSWPGSSSCFYSFQNSTVDISSESTNPRYGEPAFTKGYNLQDAWCGNVNACNSRYNDWTGFRNIKHIRDWHGGGGRWKLHTWKACPTCFYQSIITNSLAGVSFEISSFESGWNNRYGLCYDANNNGVCDTSSTESGPSFFWQWTFGNFLCQNAAVGSSSSWLNGLYPRPTGDWQGSASPWRTTRMYVDFKNNRLYFYVKNTFPVVSNWISINECRGFGANLDFNAADVRNPSYWNGIHWFVDSSQGSIENPSVSAYPPGSFMNQSTGEAGPCPTNAYCDTLTTPKACPNGYYQPGTVASACTLCPGGAASTPNLAKGCGASKNAYCTVTATANGNSCGTVQLVADGNFGNVFCTGSQADNWIRVDLESSQSIGYVSIWNRNDCCPEKLDGFKLWIGDSGTYNGAGNVNCFTATSLDHRYYPYNVIVPCVGSGRYFFLHLPQNTHLQIVEIEIFPSLPYTGTAMDICGCPPGQYTAGGACIMCPAGTYRATQGATSLAECLPCPQYSYSPYKGSSACTTCAANV